jgi:hypothetical protein
MKVLVLYHEAQRGRPHPAYILDACAAVWRERGHEVSLAYGIGERPAADLVVPHVDLTRTPPEYVAWLESYPRVLNRGCYDVAKRRISRQLVAPGDGYDGPVILKTDLNYGGRPEEQNARRSGSLSASWRARFAPALERLLRRPFAFRRTLDDYPVFARPQDVPPAAWRNPAFVVERFLPEREGAFYCVRHYAFLGDRFLTTRFRGPAPFVKRPRCEPAGRDFPPAPAVVEFRRALGLDFGKIDYVEHEGRAHVVDVNRTPSLRGDPIVDRWVAETLGPGVDAFLPRPGS